MSVHDTLILGVILRIYRQILVNSTNIHEVISNIYKGVQVGIKDKV